MSERTLRDARLTFETRQQVREARSDARRLVTPWVPDWLFDHQPGVCPQCAEPFAQSKFQKGKVFCSDTCRKAANRARERWNRMEAA